MSISLRRFQVGFIFLFAAVLTLEAIQSSWTFRVCKIDYENDKGGPAQSAALAPFVNKVSEYIYVRLRCDGKFVTRHPEVTSFFVVGLITLFSVVLWIFVSRIMRVTQQQLLLTQQSIDTNKNLLLSIHKPELTVRGFSLEERTFAENHKIQVKFTVTNKGNSTAVVNELASTVILVSKYIPTDVAFVKRALSKETLKSGERSNWHATSETPLTAADLQALRSGERGIVCVGYFTYEDALGTFRVTGFARQYDVAERHWSVPPDTDYDYSS